MTHTAFILFNGYYTVYSLAAYAIVGFVAGFFIRLAINAKQKRQVLKLEDEMLNNHSRILSLEKKISSLEKENAELSKFSTRKSSLKAS